MGIIAGDTITWEGELWFVADTGSWGLRCERGSGKDKSIIVIPWTEYLAATEYHGRH